MDNRIWHVGMTVKDVDRSLKFYRDVLGFKVDSESEAKAPSASQITGIPGTHTKRAYMSLNGQVIQLLQYLNPVGPVVDPRMNVVGCAHLALDTGDLSAFLAHARKHGAPVQSDVVTTGFGFKMCSIRDPDGYTVEVREAAKG